MNILVTEQVEGEALTQLSTKYRVVRDPTLWNDRERLRKEMASAKALIVRNQTQVTAELIDAAPMLVAIGRIGVGLDNVDLETASARGIVVIAPLGANAISVAELTIGLILSLTRKIPQANQSAHAGQWERHAFTGVELYGKTLAICGFGRIGQLVAQRAQAFGLKLAIFDPYISVNPAALGLSGVEIHRDVEAALETADVVTVHVPLTEKTRGMFNEARFARMKRGAFFVNTSRGSVVSEAALVQALERGHLAGAALDVRETEPAPARGRLDELPNVILTPHIASFSVEAQTRTVEAVAADLDRLMQGEPALNFVNFSRPRRPFVP